MAKVRVYELAKDLNMTNRALLNKMKELKIEVKSHMSSLEDGDISAIKKSMFGKKKQKNGVKIKPSVIRRRKQKVEEIAEPDPEPDSEKDITEEMPAEEVSVKEVIVETEISQADPGKAVSEDQPVEESAGEALDAKEVVLKKKSSRKKAKNKKSQPAKIVKPVEQPEPEEVPSPVKSEEPVVEQKKSEESLLEGKTQEGETQKAAVEEPLENEKIVSEISDPESDSQIIKESKDTEKSDDQEAEDLKKESKKKKKKRKSTPAKIVKIADPRVLENLKKIKSPEDKKRTPPREETRPDRGARKPVQQRKPLAKKETGFKKPVKGAQAPGPDIVMPPDADAVSRKKDRRREVPEAEFSAKRKKRKKKSVVEGNDIYKGRGRKKRGKKDTKTKKGNFQKTQITTPKAIKRRIKIDEAIELAELAKRMGIKANEMIAKLMTMGVMATVNQTIDFDTATLVATEFDFEVEKASFEEDMLLNIQTEEDDEEDLIASPPVVTIMGHVDHGKTSLLDVIRKSKITSGEAGGITQHIGAYNVETPNGGRITFLDTPGHAAFTAMRSRGAKVTDIVILVVAADDGVMPQTMEAINHAKAAEVPVVVAVNKMDKVGADPDKIMRELSEHDLLSEEWGGKVIFVKVSAKTGEGIDELLEMIILQSEVLELKANPDRKATGYVVESRLDVGRGAVATVLVKQGTLRDGDPIVCGLHSGRIRAMIDDSGERIKAAGPSTPAEIVGLTGVPDAGDEFIAVDSDKDAKQIAGHRMQKQRAKELAKKSRANLEKMFENLGSAEIKELKLIVKADVHGSIEALNDSLKDLAKEEVDIKIVHSGAGTINESDVALAAVSDAIIIGFNVRPSPQIRKMAKDENVDMRFYDIIYNVINDIKAALDGMMPSTFHEIIIGRAEVRDTFVVPKMGTIAGCHVVEGKVVRGKKIRLLRDGVIKCDTALSSLRRFKDDVKEVDQGYECGIGLEKYNDIKVDDAIECYEVEERKYKGE